ncbi:hypothetical protein IFM89_037344 [Coptis chinensis]|uniref:Uncharacterized protein n=1 Tax=Coptis chinensis TaxID=261450 RepID=A0A835IJD5_9MAGN|nr:hypothetical protein IFM89_037344 [Coptis chinensis]
MSGYSWSLKMKRKELEDVYDDFSDFSLSSPARKIRRLDADLPPIMEEEDQLGIPVDIEMPTVSRQIIEQEPLNEERALVLYKPVNTSPLQLSDLSITVNGDLFPGLKNGSFWSGYSGLFKTGENQTEPMGKNAGTNNCLAVVPWVSNKLPSAPGTDSGAVTELSEPMEAEDVEVMEIEDDSNKMTSEEQAGNTNAWGVAEGLQQWQQQHCMTPQLPPSTATPPVMWSW